MVHARDSERALSIALVVHGRFHAFDLARELVRQKTDVVVFTNYPKRIAHKFGVPPERVVSFLAHGILSRAVAKTRGRFRGKPLEPFLHQVFGRWAARSLSGRSWDAIHSFSGVSEEVLREFPGSYPITSLVRGSAHIEVQARLLCEEEGRAGVAIDTPSEWMIEREKCEYALANLIIVLSSFARRSFVERGVPTEKLRVLLLGSELGRFRPSESIIEDRCVRILSGKPLKILTVGSFSHRKGAFDLTQIASRLSKSFDFRFVGDIASEAGALRRRAEDNLCFEPRRPQAQLSEVYNDSDLFLFPTIEDGYAVVLAQASSAGLPVLATTNCAAPDLVAEGETGWVLPIRSPELFVDRLRWCDVHRTELAQMVRNVYHRFRPRDWSEVATDLNRIYLEWREEHPKPAPHE